MASIAPCSHRWRMLPAWCESHLRKAVSMRLRGSDEMPEQRPALAFAVGAAAAVLMVLEISKANVLLEPISRSINAGPTTIQLVISGYVLAFGICLVPAGRIGDRWSRRNMFLIGIVIFLLGSALTAIAGGSGLLVGGRAIQGVGAGIVMPQVLGLVQQLYSGEARGRALGLLGAAIGLGAAAGPIISGTLVATLGEDAGWRWAFGVNLPGGALLVVLGVISIPKEQPRVAGAGLDGVGVTLLALAVLALMFPFVMTTGTPSDPGWRWLSLGVAVIIGAIFIGWEHRYARSGHTPVLETSLFRLPPFRNGILIATCFLAAVPAALLVITLFLMQGQGHSALVAAVVTVPYMLVAAVVAVLVGKHTHRHSNLLVTVGLLLFLAGLVGAIIATQVTGRELTPLWVGGALAISGVGAGSVLGPNQWRTLNSVPVQHAGVAGSFMQVGQRVGNAIGAAICLSVFIGIVGSASDLDAHRHAILVSLLLVTGAVVAALCVATADWWREWRDHSKLTDSVGD